MWLLSVLEHWMTKHSSHHSSHLLEGVTHTRACMVGEEIVSLRHLLLLLILLLLVMLLRLLLLRFLHVLSVSKFVGSSWHIYSVATLALVDLGTVRAWTIRDCD